MDWFHWDASNPDMASWYLFGSSVLEVKAVTVKTISLLVHSSGVVRDSKDTSFSSSSPLWMVPGLDRGDDSVTVGLKKVLSLLQFMPGMFGDTE